MSFSIKSFQGEAQDYRAEVAYAVGHERETNILGVVKEAVEEVVSAVGGHVAVSASGHINEFDDTPGDSLNIQVSSFLRPSDPTPDAGLEAAAGSPRNFPPEASTAAPATEDNSPPATQEPNPQPLIEEIPAVSTPPAVTETQDEPVPTPASESPASESGAALEPETSSGPTTTPTEQDASSQTETVESSAPDPSSPAESAGPTEVVQPAPDVA